MDGPLGVRHAESPSGCSVRGVDPRFDSRPGRAAERPALRCKPDNSAKRPGAFLSAAVATGGYVSSSQAMSSR